MSITVCMPSYNSGTTALKNILWMQERLPKSVEYVVVDDGSTEDVAPYLSLQLNPRVRFIRHATNGGFVSGFSSALLAVEHGVAVICSDEDVIPPEGIKALKQLDWRTTAVARGSVGSMDGYTSPDENPVQQPVHAKRGAAAVSAFGFDNMYISGTAYNMELLRQVLDTYRANSWKHVIYAHLYLDLLAAAAGDVQLLTQTTALAGPTGKRAVEPSQYNTVYSLGNRIDQLIVFRDALLDACNVGGTFDSAMFDVGYHKLMARMLFLIGRVNGRQYYDARIDPIGCMHAAAATMIASLVMVPEVQSVLPYIKHDLDRILRPQDAVVTEGAGERDTAA